MRGWDVIDQGERRSKAGADGVWSWTHSVRGESSEDTVNVVERPQVNPASQLRRSPGHAARSLGRPRTPLTRLPDPIGVTPEKDVLDSMGGCRPLRTTIVPKGPHLPSLRAEAATIRHPRYLRRWFPGGNAGLYRHLQHAAGLSPCRQVAVGPFFLPDARSTRNAGCAMCGHIAPTGMFPCAGSHRRASTLGSRARSARGAGVRRWLDLGDFPHGTWLDAPGRGACQWHEMAIRSLRVMNLNLTRLAALLLTYL